MTASASEVRKTLTLKCSQEHAFRVFTERMGNWWPAAHHTGALPFRDIVIEKQTGGRWYEVDVREQKGDWGHVLAWEQPHRLVLSWHLDTEFVFRPEFDRASELEFCFIAEGPNQTRVEFVHRHIDRHGKGYEALREQLNNGWVAVLDAFVTLADKASEEGGGA
ncbi:MAG TPA: SRPBCC family protein [Burkholderiaceae bacterium]|jgi:uncharacterized protein YndB with AHSA1/START domain